MVFSQSARERIAHGLVFSYVVLGGVLAALAAASSGTLTAVKKGAAKGKERRDDQDSDSEDHCRDK